MRGVREVRFHDLFWRTIEPHRSQAYYPGLKSKLVEFVRRKHDSLAPVSSRDGVFRSTMSDLSGIWHFAILRTPDVVIFYTVDEAILSLAMVGSHHDYPSDGKNRSAGARTGLRVRNAVGAPAVPSPAWPRMSWSLPGDVLRHPDLPELSPPALDDLLCDLLDEMDTGARYRAAKGVFPEDATEVEFDRYIDELERARNLVLDVRARREGAAYWIKRPPEDAGRAFAR